MSMLPLTQRVTYWTVASVAGSGSRTWNPGIAIDARWVRKDGIYTDSKGTDHKTEYVIYAEQTIPKRSMVVLEDQDLVASPPNGAREIFMSYDNTSLSDLIKHVA